MSKIVRVAHTVIASKLRRFVADEKACNKKLENFLSDVNACSIARQERTADNSWLREGAYRSIYHEPFCPIVKKKKKH